MTLVSLIGNEHFQLNEKNIVTFAIKGRNGIVNINILSSTNCARKLMIQLGRRYYIILAWSLGSPGNSIFIIL
jgi:hypothetical protein